MTIKSDKWIRRQCTPPAFVLTYSDGRQDELATVNRFYPGLQSYRPVTEAEAAAWAPMIEPFEANQVRYAPDEPDVRGGDTMHRGPKVTSYGTSSYGYDIRAADSFKVFTNINTTIVDPKNFDPNCFVDVSGKGFCIIPPNSFALARTVEFFRIPRRVLAICLGKSTYARCGIVVNVTPLEPEWEGYLTLEFSNTTPLPAKIYAHEGIAQLLFFESDEECETSYKDRGGKYQGQGAEPTAPKL